MSTTTWTMRAERAKAVRHSWSLRATIATPTHGWLNQRNCATTNPRTFFGRNPRIARALCDTCPVRLSCLADAHTQENGTHWTDIYGIRGGLTPRERWNGRQDLWTAVDICGRHKPDDNPRVGQIA